MNTCWLVTAIWIAVSLTWMGVALAWMRRAS